jgi:PTH1 family peptidyl-tRNA hydrolase
VADELARRHQLGFEASRTDAVEAKWRVGDEVAIVVKPLTFMNLSGVAVGELCRYYRIDVADVLIVCDDVNLPLGRLRARPGGSDGGHNGLRSIAEHLGTENYARLRVGVGRGDQRRDLADHVLARFEPEELTGIREAIARSADAVETWVVHGMASVMNTFNRDQELP